MKKIVLKVFVILVLCLLITGVGNSAMADEGACTHEYVVKYDETTHWKECLICGKVDSSTIVEHAYVENICECGAIKPCEEHKEYEIKYDETNHWEECKECKQEKKDSKEKHSYVNGICKCGAKEPVKECEHKEYEIKYDETNHWEECKECKQEKEDRKVLHDFKEYKDNKDGTHTAKCLVCGYETIQKHDVDKDCEDCGYKAEETDNKVDNTVADNKIPYTGTKGITCTVVAMLIAIVAIFIIKIKEYKEI